MKLGILAALTLGLTLTSCSSALHSAALRGQSDAVAIELDKGTDVNQRFGGLTPLMSAATSGDPVTVKLLLDRGADPSQKTLNGDTALQLAKTHLRRQPTPEEERAVIDLLRAAMKLPALPPMFAARASAAVASAPALAASAPKEKLTLSSDVDSPTRHGAERPNDFALIIGIEDYQNLPKADYGVRDAETVRKHYEALGVPARSIIALEGAQATGSKLRSYLQQWLPRNVKPQSTVFVYYSGHGAPDPTNGDAYLVPWDADPMFLTTSAYPLKQFYAELAKLKAKRVLVALDACFSGSGGRSVLAKGARPLVAKVDESVPSAANLTVLAAASGSEITGTLDDQEHGIFTYYYLKGLASGAKTPRALFDYLKPKVQDDARRQNREQSPTLAGSGSDTSF